MSLFPHVEFAQGQTPFPNLGNVTLDTFRLSYLTVGQSLRIKPCHRSTVQRLVQTAVSLMRHAHADAGHPKFYIESVSAKHTPTSTRGGWLVTRMPAEWTYSQKDNLTKMTGAGWLATLAVGQSKQGPHRLFKTVDNALSAYRKTEARRVLNSPDANWCARTVVTRIDGRRATRVRITRTS